MAKFLGHKYIPKYEKDYFDLPWYERNLMSYIDHLKYKEMPDNPNTFYFIIKLKKLLILIQSIKDAEVILSKKVRRSQNCDLR